MGVHNLPPRFVLIMKKGTQRVTFNSLTITWDCNAVTRGLYIFLRMNHLSNPIHFFSNESVIDNFSPKAELEDLFGTFASLHQLSCKLFSYAKIGVFVILFIAYFGSLKKLLGGLEGQLAKLSYKLFQMFYFWR